MLDYPKTIEEAKEYRYNTGQVSTRKVSYYEGRCAYEMSEALILTYRVSQQCLRAYGYGPGKLYCRQHARRVEAYNA